MVHALDYDSYYRVFPWKSVVYTNMLITVDFNVVLLQQLHLRQVWNVGLQLENPSLKLANLKIGNLIT